MRFVCERGDAGESVLLGDVSDEPVISSVTWRRAAWTCLSKIVWCT